VAPEIVFRVSEQIVSVLTTNCQPGKIILYKLLTSIVSNFQSDCVSFVVCWYYRSGSHSVCGNQALLNTIDPGDDDNNSTICDKEDSCEIKLQLDFSKTVAQHVQNEKKERICESVQVGYVSQLVAQMEGIVVGENNFPKSKTNHDIESNPNSVKALLYRLESSKEPNQSVVNDGQTNAQNRYVVSKKLKDPIKIPCSDNEKVNVPVGRIETSNGCVVGIINESSTTTVAAFSRNVKANELKKQNDRLLEENKDQQERIEQLEAELKEMNEKVLKLYAEQFLQKRKSLDVKARLELKLKELEESVKVMNAQRLQEKSTV
jgi:hypothetical protein